MDELIDGQANGGIAESGHADVLDNVGTSDDPLVAEPEAGKAPTTLGAVLSAVMEKFDEENFRAVLAEHLNTLAAKHGLQEYHILYLLDPDELQSWHSNRIYKAASSGMALQPILLVVDNLGGRIEPGYLISKTCKALAHEKFVVAIPRKAKSAATLLSLGADEVHMGLMSELGPIDPQIGGFPALGMKNALEILSDLACRYPGASTMLADYIKTNLDMRYLGYVERINESAMQYAERLLAGKQLPAPHTAKSLADHFVNHYKDHSFVIDFDEAQGLLGPSIVKRDSPEYKFANAVYESFDLIRFILRSEQSKDADLVGYGNQVHVFDSKKS